MNVKRFYQQTAMLYYVFVLLCLLALNFGQAPIVKAQVLQSSTSVSVNTGFLNADGSLNLDGNLSGPLDLRGWNVKLDPKRGPIFGPVVHDWLTSFASPGSWAALGSDGLGNGSLNGEVRAIAVNGNDVYVGGLFTNVNNNGIILNNADYIAKWDGSTWSALGGGGLEGGSLNNYVETIVVSGSNVYVGGPFTNVNNNGAILNTADLIAKWDGTNWSALGNNGAGNGAIFGTNVFALAMSGNNLYVGGNFSSVNNYGSMLNNAGYIAKWDGANWSALGSNGAGEEALNSWVETIAVSGDNIYVGGPFTNVNNNGTVLNNADYIAKWDGTNWSSLGSNGNGDGSLNWWVHDLVVRGGYVYAGGGFTDVNNNGGILNSADYVAKWDGVNWSSLGSNGVGNGSINSSIEAIAANGCDIYTGGWFWDVNNNGVVLNAADRIAKWDGQNWTALGSDATGNGSLFFPVYSLTPGMGDLYVGGGFYDVENNSNVLTNADYIAAYGVGPSSQCSPSIAFTAPHYGTPDDPNGVADRVLGHVKNILPPDYRWAVYIMVGGGWWTKPYSYQKTTPIQPDGSWSCDIVTGGIDEQATVIRAYLIPGTYDPLLTLGGPLPELQFPYAEVKRAAIDVYIGAPTPRGSYKLNTGESKRDNYADVDTGPVKVESTNGVPIIAAIRDAWAVNGVTTSFSQLMGLPLEQLSNKYVFPGYNNVTLNEQLRIANVDTVQTTVMVSIGGVVRGTYTLYPPGSPLGASAVRVNYPGLDSGPVIVEGTAGVDIISAIREAWAVNGVTTSFIQLMGLPAGQLSNKYVFPAYNNVTLNEQLRIANVDAVQSTVTVTIGGVLRGTYTLYPPGSPLGPSAVRINYPSLDSGPVVVEGTAGVEIISAIREAWAVNGVTTSFSQLMGMPAEQLSNKYLFPAYNNATLNEQLRISNVDTVQSTVTVRIGGVERGTYTLYPPGSPLGASAVRINYPSLDSGPVVVEGTPNVDIISAIREAWAVNGVTKSFVQFMGLPAGQLSTTFLFPAYNNVTLNEQLRFGVP